MCLSFVRCVFISMAAAAAALGTSETGLVFTLIPPAGSVSPDGVVNLRVAVLNATSRAVTVDAASTLPAKLIAGATTVPVTLVPVESATPVRPLEPGSFLFHSYTMHVQAPLPAGPSFLEVRLADGATARAVLDIAASHGEAALASTRRPTTSLVRAQTAAPALRRTFADRLTQHEPIYFIYGLDAPAAKFQLSFKYKLIDFTGLRPQRMVRTLQFGYTQRSLWDIGAESSPFYDTSYMPELMYESLAPMSERGGGFNLLGFQAGYKHESNGREGPFSRTVNTVYVRPVIAFGALDGWHLLVAPEMHTYLSDMSENPDLDDYRGYGQVRFVFGRNDRPSLMVTLWTGREFEHGSVQLDLTVPVRTRLLGFETYVLLQYFNGYGESLRAYREHTEAVRAGFSVVR